MKFVALLKECLSVNYLMVNEKEDWSDLVIFVPAQNLGNNVWSLPTSIAADREMIKALNNKEYTLLTKLNEGL